VQAVDEARPEAAEEGFLQDAVSITGSESEAKFFRISVMRTTMTALAGVKR